MSFNPIARAVALATVGTSLMIPALSQAALVEDTKASLSLRNMYIDRTMNVDEANEVDGYQWGQGFRLDVISGYTEGTVGVGFDVMGLMGVKLGTDDHINGIGVLQYDNSGDAHDAFGELRGTFKAKVSNTELKLGTIRPNLMVISPVDNRLLPAHYKGGMIHSTDIENLTLDAGRATRRSLRNDSSYDDLPYGDYVDFFQAGYNWGNGLTTTYGAGHADDYYKQHIFNLVHVLPIADGQSLKSDLRYARSNEDGNSGVDNKAFGAMFTYALGSHKFGLAYQKMSGDTGYVTPGTDNPFLVNYVQWGSFSQADEQSWQVRYDYDFAKMGVPGLVFFVRYITGDDFDDVSVAGSDSHGKEWERNIDVKYTFQEGPVKGLSVQVRNAVARSNSSTDVNDNRLIFNYTLPLL